LQVAFLGKANRKMLRARTPEIAPPARVVEAVGHGSSLGWHLGGQLFAARGGEPVINWAFGEASPGAPMTTEVRLPWACAAKPLVAVALAQLVEDGVVSWSDPVASWIPELAGGSSDAITIEHLLTYSSGIRRVSAIFDRELVIAEIAGSELDYPPGEGSLYNGWTNWFLLGEILRRADHAELADVLRRRVCDPIGMELVTGPLDPEADATLYNTAVRPQTRIDWYHPRATEGAAGFVRAPVSDLAAFYVELMRPESELLSRETLDVMVEPRVFGVPWVEGGPPSPFGFTLGLMRGWENVFPDCSTATFGYDAGELGVGLADPERDLVVAFLANGAPGVLESWARMKDVTAAVFEVFGS
jgi:CubicO group peptidase (beta-lactamase class C family)